MLCFINRSDSKPSILLFNLSICERISQTEMKHVPFLLRVSENIITLSLCSSTCVLSLSDHHILYASHVIRNDTIEFLTLEIVINVLKLTTWGTTCKTTPLRIMINPCTNKNRMLFNIVVFTLLISHTFRKFL